MRSALSAVLFPYCAQSYAFFSRLATPLIARDKSNYDTLIRTIVAGGVWPLIDDLLVIAAPASGTALTNLRSASYTATNVGSTFTAYRGFAGNALTQYIDTNYNPSTAANYSQNSAHHAAWNRTARAGAVQIIEGVATNGVSVASAFPRFTDDLLYSYTNGPSGYTVSNLNSDGFLLNNRSSSSAVQAYRNGVAFTAGTETSAAVPNRNWYLLGMNGSGTLTFPTSDQIAAFCVGGSLTAAQQLVLYTALNTYMVAVGAA